NQLTEYYWEAWRVPPKEKEPAKSPASKDEIELFGKAGIKLKDINAHDWVNFYSNLAINKSGTFEFKGEVFYIDCLKELPKAFGVQNVVLAVGLPSMFDTPDNRKAVINPLFKKHKVLGPFPHRLKVSWTADKPETKIESKTP